MTSNALPKDERSPAPVVYVIEDDDVQRRGLVRFLSREGFEVVEFADGESAVASLKDRESKSPDLVICDYRLPGKNGLEIGNAAQQMAPEAGFILISAYVDTAVITEAHEIGAAAVLEKPLGMEELFEECRSIIFAA